MKICFKSNSLTLPLRNIKMWSYCIGKAVLIYNVLFFCNIGFANQIVPETGLMLVTNFSISLDMRPVQLC